MFPSFFVWLVSQISGHVYSIGHKVFTSIAYSDQMSYHWVIELYLVFLSNISQFPLNTT